MYPCLMAMCFRNTASFPCLVCYVTPSNVERAIEKLVPGDDGFYDLVSDAEMTNAPTDWPIDPVNGPGLKTTFLAPADDGEGNRAWTVLERCPDTLPAEGPLVVVTPYAAVE